jgi:large subunit ribosomal protein L6
MSRVAKNPIELPKGVEVTINGQNVTVKGTKGSMSFDVPTSVSVAKEENEIKVGARNEQTKSNALAGTVRAVLNNIVTGVSAGFERKLQLVGVGYRAQAQGRKLNMSLGFSHPIEYDLPEGITAETPTQTEVLIKGMDRQLVGQVASEIRGFRPPEPYKGKGVRYSDENVRRKETKKK